MLTGCNLWSVTASTIEDTDKGTMHRQSPSFIINGNTHGVTDEAGVVAVAQKLLNPLGLDTYKVFANAVKI